MHLMQKLIRIAVAWLFGIILLFVLSDSQSTCTAQAQGPVFCRPTTGTVTQGYSQGHTALDISGGVSGSKGNAVRAPYNGTVVYVGMAELVQSNPNKIKHTVAVNHGLINGKYVLSLFVHLGSSTESYVTVSVGQQVQRGQILGYQGNAGQATGVHVHWEVHEYTQPFLNAYTSWGIGCTRSDLWWEFGGNPTGTCHNANPAGAVDPQAYAGPLSGYITETCTISYPPNVPNLLAPANGSTVGSHVVTLQWQDTGDPDNAPRTYRDYSGWIWNVDNTWTQPLDWQTSTSWSVTVPAPGTYYWKIQSGDGAQGSGWTSTWSFNVPNQPPNKPNLIAPSNGSVSTNRTITLQWQDTGDPDNAPRTYRDYSGWIWSADNSWTQPLDWQTSTSWSVTVPADGTYYWKMQSGDGAVGSGWADTWSFTVNSIPNMPTNLAQSDAIHDMLAISWQDNASNEDGFRIYKWVWDGASWEFRYYDTVGPNTTMFTDVNLSCASDYYYQVSAYNSFGESERAIWTKASTTACPTPAQPSDLSVSGTTESSVSLSWQDNSTDEDGFYIYRWDWNGIAWDFYNYATTSANTTSFTDIGLSCDAHYFYVISAYNSYGESGRVGFVEGITNACGDNTPTPTAVAPIPPTNTPTNTPVMPPTATATPIATPTATPEPPSTTNKHWVFVPLTVR